MAVVVSLTGSSNQNEIIYSPMASAVRILKSALRVIAKHLQLCSFSVVDDLILT